jgi:hypothetical protein
MVEGQAAGALGWWRASRRAWMAEGQQGSSLKRVTRKRGVARGGARSQSATPVPDLNRPPPHTPPRTKPAQLPAPASGLSSVIKCGGVAHAAAGPPVCTRAGENAPARLLRLPRPGELERRGLRAAERLGPAALAVGRQRQVVGTCGPQPLRVRRRMAAAGTVGRVVRARRPAGDRRIPVSSDSARYRQLPVRCRSRSVTSEQAHEGGSVGMDG